MGNINYTFHIHQYSRVEDVLTYLIRTSISGSFSEGNTISSQTDKQPFTINYNKLLEYRNINPEKYGEYLTMAFFNSELIKSEFTELYGMTLSGNNLHIKITLDPCDEYLNDILWERLRNPHTGNPLICSKNIWFSRSIINNKINIINLPDRPNLHVLAVMANPKDIERFNLASIDTDNERHELRKILDQSVTPLEVTVLAQGSKDGLPTLDECKRQIEMKPVHILYLVCHGRGGTNPCLYLEDDRGHTAPTKIDDFIDALNVRQPLLIFLASCYSAGFNSLGPMLAKAGIPAIIGMQDAVAMETIQKAMPVFFYELTLHGHILHALTTAREILARGQLLTQEWWNLVLFLQIPNGQLWIDPPGFNEICQALEYHIKYFHSYEIDKRDLVQLSLLLTRSSILQHEFSSLICELRESPDGLETLLRRVFSSEVNTQIVRSIDEQIARIPVLMRVLPWSMLLNLRQILIGEVLPSDIQERARHIYYRCHPEGLRAKQIPVGVSNHDLPWWIAKQLSLYLGDGDKKPPLLEYVYTLLQSSNFPTTNRERLRNWYDSVPDAMKIHVNSEDQVDNLLSAPNTESSVLFIFQGSEQEIHQVSVQIWFTKNRYEEREWKRVRNLEPNTYWLIESIGEHITKTIDELFSMIEFNLTNLHIEIALPYHLLFYPIDQIELSDLDDPEPLGTRQPLIIRSSDRLLSQKAAVRQNWELRWASWCTDQKLDTMKSLWLRTVADCSPNSLIDRLKSDPRRISCLIGCYPLPDSVQTAVARRISNQGIPIVIWYRAPDGLSQDLELEVSALIQHCHVHQRLLELRRDTSESNVLGRHIMLLWDDPDRLPSRRRLNPPLSPPL